MLTEVFNNLTEIVSGWTGIFADLFNDNGIISIFWSQDDGLQFMGSLALLVVGLGFVRFGFGLVLRFLQMRG